MAEEHKTIEKMVQTVKMRKIIFLGGFNEGTNVRK